MALPSLSSSVLWHETLSVAVAAEISRRTVNAVMSIVLMVAARGIVLLIRRRPPPRRPGTRAVRPSRRPQ